MRRAIHLLIVAAVLWCGLHLSPAEADVVVSATAETSAAAHADHDASDDHPLRQASHGCHSHCPLAIESASSPALGTPLVRASLVALPSPRLASLSLAPPIEPPIA